MKYILLLLIFTVFFVSESYTQTVDSLGTIVAKQGDGIYKILRENGYSAKDYYNDFLELNKDKIDDNDALIKGEEYFLPLIRLEEPVLTDTIAIVDSIQIITINYNNQSFADTIIDNSLRGAVFYIVSGHGGPDPGAITEVEGQTLCEDEYAYDISLRIAQSLEERGAKVFMIINDPNDSIREEKYLKLDYDEYCYPDLEIPRNQNARLKQRADAVNDLYKEHKDSIYHRVLVIHVDSRTMGAKVDVFFYHYPGSKKGKACAEAIQKVFADKYAEYQPNRGYEGTVSARNLMVIRKSLPAAVFIELGNLQNERDRKRFFNPDNRQALAKWITEGLIEDFKDR